MEAFGALRHMLERDAGRIAQAFEGTAEQLRSLSDQRGLLLIPPEMASSRRFLAEFAAWFAAKERRRGHGPLHVVV
jgi:hypothetical protein